MDDRIQVAAALTVHLSGGGSAVTEAMVRVMEQAGEAAGLAAFRAGVGRTPEPSPERTARLAALPLPPRRYRRDGDRWVHVEGDTDA